MPDLESSVVLEARNYFHNEYASKVRASGYELISKVIFHRKSFQILALIEHRSNRTQIDDKTVLGLIPAAYKYKNTDIPVFAELEPDYTNRMRKKAT